MRRYARFKMSNEFLAKLLELPDDVRILSAHSSGQDSVEVHIGGDTIECPDDGTVHNLEPVYEKGDDGVVRLVGWQPWQ